jgi:hypothetical protein
VSWEAEEDAKLNNHARGRFVEALKHISPTASSDRRDTDCLTSFFRCGIFISRIEKGCGGLVLSGWIDEEISKRMMYGHNSFSQEKNNSIHPVRYNLNECTNKINLSHGVKGI